MIETGVAICLCVLGAVAVRAMLDTARIDWERNAFELGRDFERGAVA